MLVSSDLMFGLTKPKFWKYIQFGLIPVAASSKCDKDYHWKHRCIEVTWIIFPRIGKLKIQGATSSNMILENSYMIPEANNSPPSIFLIQ